MNRLLSVLAGMANHIDDRSSTRGSPREQEERLNPTHLSTRQQKQVGLAPFVPSPADKRCHADGSSVLAISPVVPARWACRAVIRNDGWR
jgi:hypothetical protein